MKRVDFVPFLLTDTTDIFSIRIEGEQHTEVEKFLVLFKDSENHYVQADLESILKAISNISQNGALESFFRPEGSWDDRIVALPIYVVPRNKEKEGTLRLYGIRVSDNLLIVGGGGLKTTRTYEEDEALHKHVVLLQRIDRALKMLSSQGLRVQDEIFRSCFEMVAEVCYMDFSRQFHLWKRERSRSYVTDEKGENGRKGRVNNKSNYFKTAS